MLAVFQRVPLLVVLILSGLIGWSGSVQAAGTLWAFVVTDVTDKGYVDPETNKRIPGIGTSVEKDRANIKALLKDIEASTGLTLKGKLFHKKEQLSAPKIINQLQKMEIGRDDVVFFYFSGHGVRIAEHDSKWPKLELPGSDHVLWMSTVIEQVNDKNPRLAIVMADSCNWLYGKPLPKDTASPFTADPADPAAGYKALFLHSKGTVYASGSSKGETAVGLDKTGGMFTNAFRGVLAKDKGDACARWETLMKKATKPIRVKNVGDKEHVQHPQAEVAVTYIPPKKEQQARDTDTPMCEPPELSAPPETVTGNTEGFFEGRRSEGKVEIILTESKVSGSFKGTTTSAAFIPAGGRTVGQPDGSLITSGRVNGEARTVIDGPDDIVRITERADGAVVRETEEREGFNNEYSYRRTVTHPKGSGKGKSLQMGEGFYDPVTFSGRVQGTVFNPETGSIQGSLTGAWTLNTEHCETECGPTSGEANGRFSGFVEGSGFIGTMSWILKGFRNGQTIAQAVQFETFGGTVVPGKQQPEPAPSPRPEPKPAPTPAPSKQPAPAPSPEPKPTPQPAPNPQPAPQPTPYPQPQPYPLPQPAPQPQPPAPSGWEPIM